MTYPFSSTAAPGFLLVAALIGLAACSGGETASGRDAASSGRADLRIVVVTHGQASDPFWSVVKRGVDQAARDMGITAEYQAPERFDMVAMSQLIDAAVASRPDGLVVSIPDADALGPALRAAREAGIPFISINAGGDAAHALGALIHVGQSEYEAGRAGGARLAAAGVRKALCVNHEVGNLSQDLRCQGFADAMQAAGAASQLLAVEQADPTESQQRIQAALASDPDLDGLLTLGPTGALAALQALRAEEKSGAVRLATFDLSPEILDAITSGEMLFAIDQQMYLQGYLPLVLLALYNRNLNTVANAELQTGPGFVTRENVDRLEVLTQQGTR